MRTRYLLPALTILLASAAFAADEQDIYNGSYTNPEWKGGKMTILIAKEAKDGKHAGTVNCIWEDDFYTYPASFDPIKEDGTLVGKIESEDSEGEPATYIVKGKVKDKTYTALYWMEGGDEPADADEADGTITLKLGDKAEVVEEE